MATAVTAMTSVKDLRVEDLRHCYLVLHVMSSAGDARSADAGLMYEAGKVIANEILAREVR